MAKTAQPPGETHGLWKALDDNCFAWNDYRIYRGIQGWSVFEYGKRSRRVGNTELMSQAMALANKDATEGE